MPFEISFTRELNILKAQAAAESAEKSAKLKDLAAPAGSPIIRALATVFSSSHREDLVTSAQMELTLAEYNRKLLQDIAYLDIQPLPEEGWEAAITLGTPEFVTGRVGLSLVKSLIFEPEAARGHFVEQYKTSYNGKTLVGPESRKLQLRYIPFIKKALSLRLAQFE